MTQRISDNGSERPSVLISIGILLASMLIMAWLRFYVYPHQVVVLTYGLPLLLCLWHRDRILLWSMSAAFIVMAAIKAFLFLPDPNPNDFVECTEWLMQVINILAVSFAVHSVLGLTGRLQKKKAIIQQSNEELAARQDELARQNEELQTQTEELAHQNEEIQQQSEELQQQSEELRATNVDLNKREAMLQTMLESCRGSTSDKDVLNRVSSALFELLSPGVEASAVLEKVGDELVVRAGRNINQLARERWSMDRSFAAVVMEHDRTAFVDDLKARPDLIVPKPMHGEFRSLLATPLRVGGQPAGVVEVYSLQPQTWSQEQFRIIEWVALQCSLALEVRRLHSDLTAANANLDQLVRNRTRELELLVNDLEHFSYTITHDMRAPLRAMQGFAAMLSQECLESLTPQQKDYLRRITTSAGRMDRLITDALDYSKAIRQELNLDRVDPLPLLKGMIESYPTLQPPAATVEIAGDLPPVLANEAALTQCFSNLLGNAVKFVEPQKVPHVRVRADRVDGCVRFWVEDDGIGIAPEMKLRVFDMFQRGSKQYEGTGIGLALVKKVAQQMGGRVGVESELGKGSRFWLELPAAN